MARKLNLSIPILTDQDNTLAKQFGLVFTIPDALKEIYLSFGIDLERHNGNATWQLPMPASYVIATDGIISTSAVNVNHTNRPEPEELLRGLEALAS